VPVSPNVTREIKNRPKKCHHVLFELPLAAKKRENSLLEEKKKFYRIGNWSESYKTFRRLLKPLAQSIR